MHTSLLRPRQHPAGFIHFSRRRLPLALALLLAACGGGGGGGDNPATPSTAQRLLAQTSAETALTPVAATANSAERGDLSASAAIDRNDSTRWGSGFTDNEYLTLDFGTSQRITRVHIAWENAHASAYLLQVSDDNTHWTTIQNVSDSKGASRTSRGSTRKAATCACRASNARANTATPSLKSRHFRVRPCCRL